MKQYVWESKKSPQEILLALEALAAEDPPPLPKMTGRHYYPPKVTGPDTFQLREQLYTGRQRIDWVLFCTTTTHGSGTRITGRLRMHWLSMAALLFGLGIILVVAWQMMEMPLRIFFMTGHLYAQGYFSWLLPVAVVLMIASTIHAFMRKPEGVLAMVSSAAEVPHTLGQGEGRQPFADQPQKPRRGWGRKDDPGPEGPEF